MKKGEIDLGEPSLFYEEEKEPEEQVFKILFTGLDGAGKTSIILALQNEFSKISSVEPTRGAQRRVFKLMGREISEWDLGGQRSYLISYIKNPSKYFGDTEVAIYVIDILDGSRILESLSYLHDVVETFRKLDIHPPINIFFHKYDPKLIHNVKVQIDNEINKIKNEILETLNYDEVYFFETSIYNPGTLINAISKILLELFPKSQLIQRTVEEFAGKLKCESLLIINKNSILLGSYFKDQNSKQLLLNAIAYFLSLNDVFEGMQLEKKEDHIIVKKSEKYFLFKPIILKEEDIQHYILVLKKHESFDISMINQNFTVFVKIFNDILKN
ncbi:MAG: ADP-ribosylation factor-like protein [Promethearchaeota archaeon]